MNNYKKLFSIALICVTPMHIFSTGNQNIVSNHQQKIDPAFNDFVKIIQADRVNYTDIKKMYNDTLLDNKDNEKNSILHIILRNDKLSFDERLSLLKAIITHKNCRNHTLLRKNFEEKTNNENATCIDIIAKHKIGTMWDDYAKNLKKNYNVTFPEEYIDLDHKNNIDLTRKIKTELYKQYEQDKENYLLKFTYNFNEHTSIQNITLKCHDSIKRLAESCSKENKIYNDISIDSSKKYGMMQLSPYSYIALHPTIPRSCPLHTTFKNLIDAMLDTYRLVKCSIFKHFDACAHICKPSNEEIRNIIIEYNRKQKNAEDKKTEKESEYQRIILNIKNYSDTSNNEYIDTLTKHFELYYEITNLNHYISKLKEVITKLNAKMSDNQQSVQSTSTPQVVCALDHRKRKRASHNSNNHKEQKVTSSNNLKNRNRSRNNLHSKVQKSTLPQNVEYIVIDDNNKSRQNINRSNASYGNYYHTHTSFDRNQSQLNNNISPKAVIIQPEKNMVNPPYKNLQASSQNKKSTYGYPTKNSLNNTSTKNYRGETSIPLHMNNSFVQPQMTHEKYQPNSSQFSSQIIKDNRNVRTPDQTLTSVHATYNNSQQSSLRNFISGLEKHHKNITNKISHIDEDLKRLETEYLFVTDTLIPELDQESLKGIYDEDLKEIDTKKKNNIKEKQKHVSILF
jgi:hypothetical protein